MNFVISDDIGEYQEKPDIPSNQYCVNISFTAGTGQKFEGACVGSGAQLSCIVHRKSILFCDENGIKFSPSNSSRAYWSGNKRYCRLGVLKIRIPVSISFFAEILAKIVNVDVPLLLGLDALTQFKALLDSGQDTVASMCDG